MSTYPSLLHEYKQLCRLLSNPESSPQEIHRSAVTLQYILQIHNKKTRLVCTGQGRSVWITKERHVLLREYSTDMVSSSL